MEKKSQNPYLTDYCLLIVYDLWQAHYQILLLILLKKFKKLNVKMNMNKKLNTKIATAFSNTQTLEII